jgi:hypothetical protein
VQLLDLLPKDHVNRGAILKLLQDVCSTPKKLPTQWKIDSVDINWRTPMKMGGEAAIYTGRHNGASVVVRKVLPDKNSSQETLCAVSVGLR